MPGHQAILYISSELRMLADTKKLRTAATVTRTD
jgi:hypothetical protein